MDNFHFTGKHFYIYTTIFPFTLPLSHAAQTWAISRNAKRA